MICIENIAMFQVQLDLAIKKEEASRLGIAVHDDTIEEAKQNGDNVRNSESLPSPVKRTRK